jgi:hypothetical protein
MLLLADWQALQIGARRFLESCLFARYFAAWVIVVVPYVGELALQQGATRDCYGLRPENSGTLRFL